MRNAMHEADQRNGFDIVVASDDAIARLDGSQIDQVVGRVALVDLAPGTLVSRSVVAERPSLADGEGVVGLSLEPGGYPAMGVSPGESNSSVPVAWAAARSSTAKEHIEICD